MKKRLAVVASLILSACSGGDNDRNAQAIIVSAGTISSQHAEKKVTQSVPGERRVYDIKWDNGSLSGVSKLPSLPNFQFSSPEIRLQDISLSFDKDGPMGQLYRLYQAAFGRTPDVGGLGFWKNANENNGYAIRQIAAIFLDSAEFKDIFGTASDDISFVDQLYRNVLKRNADVTGASFWLNALKSGVSRVDILLAFTDSDENKSATSSAIARGMAYAEPGVAYLPVSNVTGPADAPIGANIEVDGSTSTDANGDPLAFNWSITNRPSGSVTTFTNSTIAKPRIAFDKPGTYELSLIANDTTSQSFTAGKLTIVAHALVNDTGSYTCSTADPVRAAALYAIGHTYLDRNKDGIPCNAPDIAIEHGASTAPSSVTPIADTGLYKCSNLSPQTALSLFLQGHTYLDRDHDGKPCEANDLTIENILYPPASTTPTSGMCWVNGYTRKDGTHVSGYWRRC